MRIQGKGPTLLTACGRFPYFGRMSTAKKIKPTDKAIRAYYEALQTYQQQDVEHESAISTAFQTLLDQVGRHFGWTLIPQLTDTAAGRSIRPDGTFRDDYYITRGHWEAKDTHDNLETEIARRSPRAIRWATPSSRTRARRYLYQNGQQAMKADLTDPQQLADLLNAFFAYTEPAHEDFGKAIDEFKERVPDLARGLVEKIKDAHKRQPEVHRGVRRLLRAVPQLAQPEPERGGGRRDAGAAPADRAADPHDLRQPGLHPPQRDRRGSGEGDRRPGRASRSTGTIFSSRWTGSTWPSSRPRPRSRASPRSSTS